MKKVSLYLDDELWHCLRLGCVQRHTSMSAEVRQLVTTLLARWQRETPGLPPFGTAGRPAPAKE
jgi:plasmid stability protein